MVIDQALIAEATRRAASAGCVRIADALSPAVIEQLTAESSSLTFAPLEPVIGRVRQSGELARVRPFDPSLPQLTALAGDIQRGVRRSGVAGTERFLPNEAMYQRYTPPIGGISAHRDQGFYRVAIVICTLTGRAPFTLFDVVSDDVVDEWLTESGDVCILAGGGLGKGDRRPRHSVGAPLDGSRLSLTLRMKARVERPQGG